MSVNQPVLLNSSGEPIDVKGNRLSMSSNAYRGARTGRELYGWQPPLRSADADLLPDLKMLMARAHDLSRNYALTSGGIQIHLDNVIGAGLRLSAKPDYRMLGMDVDWAAEWARDVEAKFRSWANDPGCYIDVSRRLTFNSMLGMAYRQFLTTGEILSQVRWLDRPGASYKTSLQMIDPARLSNPGMRMDSKRLRGGVEHNRNGAPVAYHIREAMQSDMIFGSNTYRWRRLKRETVWGRSQVIHIFDQERPGQSRGKTGLASVLAKSKMLERFQDVSLESAVVNSMYAAVVESDFDYVGVMDALGADSDAVNAADSVLDGRVDWHSRHQIDLDNGTRIAQMYPGEHLNFTSLNHPGPNFAEFEKSFLRNMAAGLNMTYEQLSRDYSDTNYSGARAGLMESWKFFKSRRELIGSRFATEIYALWLEEAINNGDIKLPAGAPDFYQAKSAWVRSRWIGPGKGHIDPLKESKADELEMDMGTLTMEDACAERGKDWEENLEQIAREKARREALGLSRDDVRGYMASEPPTN